MDPEQTDSAVGFFDGMPLDVAIIIVIVFVMLMIAVVTFVPRQR